MDYESVLEIVDELPLKDRQRLAEHLIADLDHSLKRKADDARIRAALSGILTVHDLDGDTLADTLSDEAAEALLEQLHRETENVEPLWDAVINDRERP